VRLISISLLLIIAGSSVFACDSHARLLRLARYFSLSRAAPFSAEALKDALHLSSASSMPALSVTFFALHTAARML
jgi:hypothetical protein